MADENKTEPEEERLPPIGEEEEKKDEPDARLKELETQIAASAERETKLQGFIEQLVAQSQVVPEQEEEQPSEFPDPTVQPTEFNSAVQSLISKRMEQFTESQRQAVGEQNRVGQLWAAFTDKYPALSKHQMTVAGAVQSQIAELTGQGVNARDYAFRQQDKFLAAVAEKVTSEIGSGLDGKDNPDTGRTGGLVGGVLSDGDPMPKPDEGNSQLLTEELKKIQADSEFF